MVPESSNECLLEAVARNDHFAFAQFYERNDRFVYAICLKILQHEKDAEELTADIFFELWRKASQFRPDRGSAETYINFIARSRSIDRLRQRNGRYNVLQASRSEAESVLEAESRECQPIVAASISEEQDKLQSAMMQLDDRSYRIIRLRFFDGLSQSEIALRLGLPLHKVKYSIRHGLATVRRRLDKFPAPMGSG